MAHWETLKGVVAEDVFIFQELAATKHSMGYTTQRLGRGEVKIAAYHRTMDHCVQGGSPLDRFTDPGTIPG